MYYGNIKEFDVADGLGVRVSLFVSGCRNCCPGCFQPETWAFDYGQEFTEETEKSGGACGMYYDDSEPRYLPACYHDPDAGYPFVNDPYYIDSYEDEERERMAVYWEEENKHFEGLHIDFVPQEDIGGYFRLYSKFLPVESSLEDADSYSEDLPDGDYCADVIVIHANTVLGIDRPFI